MANKIFNRGGGAMRPSNEKVDWDAIGKEPVKIANIMATRNYGMFRFLDGNRDTKHAKKLVKSLVKIGILYQPVLVNERNEIVEGQGRFLAMQELNLPIIYTIQNGIGIKECRVLNSCSTNWGMKNYIHSYAGGEDARESYRYLELLEQEFPDIGDRVIYAAVSSTTHSIGGSFSQKIKSGEIEITDADYEKGRKTLAYIEKFSEYIHSISGRIECMQKALIFCYNTPAVDNAYLLTKFAKWYSRINPIVNERQAVEQLEMIYNFGRLPDGVEEITLGDAFKHYSRNKKR